MQLIIKHSIKTNPKYIILQIDDVIFKINENNNIYENALLLLEVLCETYPKYQEFTILGNPVYKWSF